jgi:steroid delta-isomerase
MSKDNWNDSQADRNEHYRNVLRRYVDAINRKDLETICALFADDAEIEDPFGANRNEIAGHPAIRRFYSEVVLPKLHRYEIRAPISGSGGAAAAMAIHAWVGNDEVDNISVALFDERGLIRRYVTYWGPGDRRKSESILR